MLTEITENFGMDLKKGSFLSKRGQEVLKKNQKKKVEIPKNDEDFLSLTTSESCLMFDVMKEKILQTRKEFPIDENVAFPYPNSTYLHQVNEIFIKYIKKHVFLTTSEEIIADELIIMNGATSILEALGYVLCDRFPCGIVDAPKLYNAKTNFDTIEKKVKQTGVKGFLMCNPSNPLCSSYSRDEIKKLIDICLENEIHFIADEVYAKSMLLDERGEVYKFYSAYEIVINEPDVEKKKKMEQYVHFVYSLSKDYGCAGFRVGFLYTKNEEILNAIKFFDYHQVTSNDSLYVLYHIFNDDGFITDYITENTKRLTDRFKVVMDYVSQFPHVRFATPVSGLYLFVKFDLIDTYEKEDQFHDMLITEKKVSISQGKDSHALEPGWFRIVITGLKEDKVMEGLSRIFETYTTKYVKKKKLNIKIGLNIKYDGKIELKFNELSLEKAKKLLDLFERKEKTKK